MSSEDVEDWRAERDIDLWKESLDVEPLFQHLVIAGRQGVYLCQTYSMQQNGDRTFLTLNDVWVHDALMAKRLVPTVDLIVRECEIITLQRETV